MLKAERSLIVEFEKEKHTARKRISNHDPTAATTVLSAAPFLLDRTQRHIHPKPIGNAAMRLAQNTASSMGPALYASAKRRIHTPPPSNKTNHQDFVETCSHRPLALD
jgi:hypothetical protein